MAVLIAPGASFAQCAMCRSILENNLSNGNVGIAAGINFGILYLFLAPYTFVALIAYLWYRSRLSFTVNVLTVGKETCSSTRSGRF